MMKCSVSLTQDQYNAIMSALHDEIRMCFEYPKEEAWMIETYKNNLLSARETLAKGMWANSA